ncbi:hypothetical protein K491DRAFT_756070 [Lophiostoma macrostomum CBS 122681]|uniref:Autophagy-related protein 28 n=1 Tax=Lophiostoma macrostomum CBS 122681 TaxID=1314788 RepID=A0A6A6TFT1_9PLEO|nr:hypothetical protein K491DRAFT_756070 [Lophiostoma macrostomum CBS 122681]
MSVFSSVLGSLSPKFRRSFEDSHARDNELPLYNKSPSTSPHIPPPIASSVLWNTPNTAISPQPRVPDDLLALQRRARHLEQQLQELLDAQADGLLGGLAGNDAKQDGAVSTGSTTPTVSSVRSHDRDTENGSYGEQGTRKRIGLNAARRGIFRRIQQLASIKSEELDMLDDDLRDLQSLVKKTESWAQKRSRLERKIVDIHDENTGAKKESLQMEATDLEHEIRLKEEELKTLKSRRRKVLDELADYENSFEARLASYEASLSMLNKEVASFLAKPPDSNHVPLSSSPFLSLPRKRRTLEMAHDYWQDESTRLTEKCQEVDIDRAALDEGAVLWNDVVRRVVDFEANLQTSMQRAGTSGTPDFSKLLNGMESTVTFLEQKLGLATERSWNLLVCAIGAELEAFRQGREMLEDTLGLSKKGKEKVSDRLVNTEDDGEDEEEASSSAIRLPLSSPQPKVVSKPKFFDTDDEDPDPELLISHQDTDDTD